MNANRAYAYVKGSLSSFYDEREAESLALRLLEHLYGITRREIVLSQEIDVSQQELDLAISLLSEQKPIQYIIGYEQFCAREFIVNESVLIPRPETEELVQLIVRRGAKYGKFLDIGTGSGAIAITLAKEIPGAELTAWDISEAALETARENADRLNANVKFERVDVLDLPDGDEKFDLIVSNPPYVLDSEKFEMRRNVLDYEPHTALFVRDSDPLIFYRAIVRYAAKHLTAAGGLYFEINQKYGAGVADLMRDDFQNIEIVKDIHGVDRFVIGNVKEY